MHETVRKTGEYFTFMKEYTIKIFLSYIKITSENTIVNFLELIYKWRAKNVSDLFEICQLDH